MKTWHIHIQGQVQGVGFRPYVFLLAKEYGLNGWVNNSIDGVHIEFNAEANNATAFCDDLLKKAPVLACITGHHIFQTAQKFFENFQIIHSQISGETKLLLTPDFALCADCRAELQADHNRRQGYAFITCTNCGPRYAIVHQLPYDRENTTMHTFQMCQRCSDEYENPLDRRYYSQTNSCPDCPIELTLFDSKRRKIAGNQERIIDSVVGFWQDGKIVAIKGIGGYLLTCDAQNEAAILELRKRKHRPDKPFALMFPDISSMQIVADVNDQAAAALSNHIAPIVLLALKQGANSSIVATAIAPGLHQVGAMLPYTPLYDLLLQKFGRAIVATSGNISNSPIIFQDEKALTELPQIADFMLINNRGIVLPQDDSVLKFTPFKGQQIIIRRSRGLAPTYINAALEPPKKNILATGAMLKSTFSLLHQGNAYISQYLGDLEHYDTQENYRHTAQYLLKLFHSKPEIILSDKHPEYPSTRYGQHLSEELGAHFKQVQHHIAHFGAILGEHNLLHTKEPVLGIIWDGTGLGDDEQIWGGEFFKYENCDFLRCYHFDYFDFILGDKMPKEPRISALSACWDVMGAEALLKEKFTETEWQIYAKLLQKENRLQTSSVGRIFDAVASLLGVMDVQTFEGEAAMKLETMALQYFKKNGLDFSASYFMEGAHYYRIPTKTLMTNIVMDLRKGKPVDFIAAKFHFSLAKLIKIVANNLKINKIAFSGGVFQNGLLVDLIIHHLKADCELYFHQQLSPNDENISFGQLVWYQIQEIKKSFIRVVSQGA
ncbi:MAG: carbamoyltransferase [Saprospiraceae bacterium]|nr:MAG: carbamoyltransferase [Saprospiraceae bacterium]